MFRQTDILSGLLGLSLSNSHAIERPPHEHDGNGQKHCRQQGRHQRAPFVREADRQLDRQQSEQRRELDDRVHRDRRRVFERIANGVAHDGRRVEFVPFCFSSTSTIFLALSQAPPALAMKIA